MTRCTHERYWQVSRDYPYAGQVGPENRAAHGSISYTERCQSCGAERAVNQNGKHFEHGGWVRREELDIGYIEAGEEPPYWHLFDLHGNPLPDPSED